MAQHIKTGIKGELLAKEFLEKKGYVILETNWRTGRAEVDIIAKHDDILVFVEVKTRTDDYFGSPGEFVTAHKERMIFNAAMRYMEMINYNWEIRFDIISVLMKKDKKIKIEHFVDAFFL